MVILATLGTESSHGNVAHSTAGEQRNKGKDFQDCKIKKQAARDFRKAKTLEREVRKKRPQKPKFELDLNKKAFK